MFVTVDDDSLTTNRTSFEDVLRSRIRSPSVRRFAVGAFLKSTIVTAFSFDTPEVKKSTTNL